VDTIFQPDSENADAISDQDFPNEIPESIDSEIDDGGHGISVTKLAFSDANEWHETNAPSNSSNPSSDFHAFLP
jgi:hypothetical protein